MLHVQSVAVWEEVIRLVQVAKDLEKLVIVIVLVATLGRQTQLEAVFAANVANLLVCKYWAIVVSAKAKVEHIQLAIDAAVMELWRFPAEQPRLLAHPVAEADQKQIPKPARFVPVISILWSIIRIP